MVDVLHLEDLIVLKPVLEKKLQLCLFSKTFAVDYCQQSGQMEIQTESTKFKNNTF